MNKKARRIVALLLAVLMLAALAACGAKKEGEKTAAGETGKSSSGEKVLTFGCQMYSDGLINPAAQINCAWNCMRFGVGEALFKFDDSMNVQPWLAESYTSEDLITWVIKLRDGIKFSNGTDMTATKVKESLDWVREEGPNGSSKPGKYLSYDATVTADDAANTITIVLPAADINLPGNLAYPVMEIIDVAGTSDFDAGVVGTGPYMVGTHTDLVGYEMVKNPYYRETVPYDKVIITFMGDASAKASALQAGQVDLVENITNVADLKKLQDDANYTVDIASGVRCGFSWMNFKGVLGNETLRKAILMGIDYKTICASNTIGGLYTPGFSVLPSTLAYGYDNLNNPYEYDVDAAKKLLDDAGIKDTNNNGIRELNGEDIYLRYSSYENRLLNDFSDAHTLYLTELGIGVKSQYGSSDDCWNDLISFNYDLDNNNWTTVGTGDPTEYLYNWYGPSESNFCGYQNDEYDKLFEEYLASTDTARRTEIVEKLQQILIDDAAVLVDGYYNSSMAYSKNVGYAHIHTADYYWITTEIVPAA
ncbi:MAG: ABC transporter substrate-binding protein [Oscillospiraceae bacterium]|nr:ABC transporter substrate-binding protein [Oscillospiraceae bacterium]